MRSEVTVSRTVLLVLCMAQFMLIVDVVVVNVALPSIRADLSIPDARLQLVAVAYTLTFGSLLIVFGRAGDLIGRRRLFLTGIATFTLASFATGIAQTEWQLVAARAVQGIGAAMVSPTALALLTGAFAEGPKRNWALGYWAAVGSSGAIAGQLLGGLLTHTLGWRWIFLINVPIGALAFIVARKQIVDRHVLTRGPLDARGAVLLASGLGLAVFALTKLGEGGKSPTGFAIAAAAAVVLGMFAIAERRHPAPLIDTTLLRIRGLAAANVLLAVNAATLAATLYFTTLYLQVVLGYSPLAVGAAFAPITLVILLISPRAAALTTRYGPRALLTTGFALLAAGMLLLARLPAQGTYLRDVGPALVLLAVGSGLSYAPTFIAGTSGVAADRQGLASGFLNSAQELGAAIGIAVLGAVAAATVTAPTGLRLGYRAGLLTAAALVIAAAVTLTRRLPGRPQ